MGTKSWELKEWVQKINSRTPLAPTMLPQDVGLSVCLSTCLSHAGTVSKPLNISSNLFTVG